MVLKLKKRMEKLWIFNLIMILGLNIFAQSVNITDDAAYTPDATAILDVKSTTKGVLVSRVALVSTTNPIAGTKTTGLLVWNTSTSGTYATPGFYFWNGSDWKNLKTNASQGGIKWETVTGLTQQAESNHGYLINNAAQVTITLPASPNLGDIVRITGVGAGGWKLAQNDGQKIDITQTTNKLVFSFKKLHSVTNGRLNTIAVSEDAAKIAVLYHIEATDPVTGDTIITSSVLCMSSDMGDSWTEQNIANFECQYLTISADGSKLATLEYTGTGPSSISSGYVWISSDSGATWTRYSVSGGGEVEELVMSSDGSKLATRDASTNTYWGDSVWLSSDSGATWTKQLVETGGKVNSIRMSADGSKMAVIDTLTSGFVSCSSDSGATWTKQLVETGASIGGLTMSIDGSKLLISEDDLLSWSSSNFGTTWTQQSVFPQPSVFGSSLDKYMSGYSSNYFPSDENMTIMAGLDDDDMLMYTIDSGRTWQQEKPSLYCSNCVISNNGILIGDTDGDYLLIGRKDETTSGTPGYLTGYKNSSVELQYVGDGNFISISHAGNIDSN